MIGYRVSLPDLEREIESESPGWLDETRRRTDEFRRIGRFQEEASIWSRAKPVYTRLQGDCKCVYCERKLEPEAYGKGEQDVEHFRPKRSVKRWRAPRALSRAGIVFAAVPPGGGGYHLLAYHPFNYAAACIPCNRALKRDYFPVAAAYDLANEDPVVLAAERPFLIYPIGDFDARPEDLIEFHGLSPRPSMAAGHDRERALVTIEFFKLDDLKRKNLFRERAVIIVALYPQLEKLSGPASAAEKNKAEDVVRGFTSPKAPHTNCAASFVRLFLSDPAEAREFFERACDLVVSMS
ncbi:MAG TPA: hypothetical protein VFR81_08275 [Longimicrobium sp.]|nr:hypothetical protein [Longimicrobium sp.]